MVNNMTPSQIITQDSEKRGLNPQATLSLLAQGVKNKSIILLHRNNSVLAVRLLGSGNCEIFLFALDSPLTLIGSGRFFVTCLRNLDLHTAYIRNTSPALLKFLERLGEHVQHSDRPEFEWMIKKI